MIIIRINNVNFSGEFVEEQEYEYFKCFLSKLKRINEKFVARAVKEEFDK